MDTHLEKTNSRFNKEFLEGKIDNTVSRVLICGPPIL